jgi:hypothetical protein
MKRTVIRYRTHPDRADENARLIAAVFQELAAQAPDGVRYMALRLADDSFVHIVENVGDGPSPLTQLPAFRAFQAGIAERCLEAPRAAEATVVGAYRMLGES